MSRPNTLRAPNPPYRPIPYCLHILHRPPLFRSLQTRLVNLIHSMGGSIRKDMNCKVTHLICNSAGGYKYKYAITFRLGVVRPDWVEEAWQSRDQPEFMATKDEFMVSHRLRVFEGQHVCFTGFPVEEHKHMEEVLRSNGGIPSTIDNVDCTHVVSARLTIICMSPSTSWVSSVITALPCPALPRPHSLLCSCRLIN